MPFVTVVAVIAAAAFALVPVLGSWWRLRQNGAQKSMKGGKDKKKRKREIWLDDDDDDFE